MQLNVNIWSNRMASHTEKDLKLKMSGEKSLYLSQGCRYRKKFEIKAKKNRPKNSLNMNPNSGSWSQIAWIIFSKIFIL